MVESTENLYINTGPNMFYHAVLVFIETSLDMSFNRRKIVLLKLTICISAYGGAEFLFDVHFVIEWLFEVLTY